MKRRRGGGSKEGEKEREGEREGEQRGRIEEAQKVSIKLGV